MASPILSLSGELLVSIVTAGQEEWVPKATFKPEWTLSHTSSRFREALLSASSLWTLVEADLDAEGSIEIARLYLERSKVCKIRVHLHYDVQDRAPGADAEEDSLIIERVHQFVPHINRTWRLSIVLGPDWEAPLLAPLHNIAAQNLQHLEISNETVDRVYRPGSNRAVQLFSAGAPKLSFVKMVGFIPFPASLWTAALKHLELWQADADVAGPFVEIATRCASLVHLYLDMRDIALVLEEEEYQYHIPSLTSLHITITDGEDGEFMVAVIDSFNTPSLTELLIDNAHGEQIFALFNSSSLPRASFPALNSLCFINVHPCSCEDNVELFHTISTPPLALFPALSSLTLINQCFTANLVKDIFGSHSQPWPLLRTVTLCPLEGTLEAVSDAIQIAVRSKHQRGEPLPKFRLAPALASLENWQEIGADVEIFDPAEILDAFHSP